MELIDLLSVICEGSRVQVWKEGELIAEYDGKNSIDEELNTLPVKSVWAGLYKIVIEV